jgi:hypothetical protein
MPVSRIRKKKPSPSPSLDKKRVVSVRIPLAPPRPVRPRFSFRARTFWAPVTVLAGAYLLLWALNFSKVYGWLTDDHLVFLKAVATVSDWRQAFLFYFNALQPYFFVISYLPVKFGWALSSHILPVFGARTGQFRFLLFYTVVLHTALFVIWACFARSLAGKWRVAVLGLALWLCSPTVYFYGPQPDSRLMGLPFALLGIWIVLAVQTSARPLALRLAALFGAGLLLGLAQSIHYTALYLIVPICTVLFAAWLFWRRREIAVYAETLALGAGCLVVPAAMEFISRYSIKIPWDQGPLMAMNSLRTLHVSYWGIGRNLLEWADFSWSQFGLPMLICFAWGFWILMRRDLRAPSRRSWERSRALVNLSIPAAVMILVASKSMPFFRQLSVLEPFLYLFAAVAIFDIAAKLRFWMRRPLLKVALISAIAAVIPVWNAAQVFRAHQALGSALDWIERNKLGRQVHSLPIFWYPDPSSFQQVSELRFADPSSLLLVYFPYQFLQSNPSFRVCLEDTKPLASWASLWGTEHARTQTEAFYVDQQFRHEPELSEVRVYLVGDLQKNLEGRNLGVTAVRSDSIDSPQYQAANVFDDDSAPNGISAWASADTPGPHFVEFDLAQPTLLSEMRVISPSVVLPIRNRQYFGRIADLEVQGDAGDGKWRSLWRRDGLEINPVSEPHWPAISLSRLRCVVRRQVKFGRTAQQAAIEEIRLPGFTIRPPASVDVETGISAASAQISGSTVTVVGQNFTPHTVINLQGVALPTKLVNSGMLRATILKTLPILPGQSSLYLTDGLRRTRDFPMPSVLNIVSVRTDSDFGGGYNKTKLFDDGESADHITSWASSDRPMPHFVELTFAGAPAVGELSIVNRPYMRIDELDVEIHAGGRWVPVFQGKKLRGEAVISPKWEARPIDALRIIVRKNYFNGRERNNADIEEILFPGFWPSVREHGS